jgi:hypothetical protein
MATPFILACKELNGIIYLARLPQTVDANTPGIPDTGSGGPWFAVGPGLRPSIQEYWLTGGTQQYVLSFDYLSHMFTRVIDTTTWPPTTVNPISTPVPYPGGAWSVQLSQDALSLKFESNLTFGPVNAFLNPPILMQPTVFDNPATIPPTFSVTLTLDPSYSPQVPIGYTPFYRLYRRTFTPSIGPWEMLPIAPSTENWQANTLSYVDSNPSILQFQYSATLGVGFNDQAQWDPNAHNEGEIGLTYITVDSTIGHLNFQLFLDESLTLDETSYLTFANFDRRSMFIVQQASDEIQLSYSLLGQGGQVIPLFGVRGLFITANSSDSIVFPEMGGVTPGPNNFKASTFAMSAYIGT